LIGIGMLIRWKKDDPMRLAGQLKWPLLVTVVLALLLSFMLPNWTWQALAGLMMALWIATTVVQALAERLRNRSLMSALRSTPRGFYGMLLGHIGIAFFIVGMTLVSLYEIEKDLRMKPGDSFEMQGYTFTFNGVRYENIANYQAARGDFVVTTESGYRAVMHPEKRIYLVQKNPMTEAAIDAGFTRDLFVALGEEIGDDGAWAVRIYYKPFIRWIWLGAIIMSIGGLLAGTDKRYRILARREVEARGTAGSVA
jgi:cytochrome c-type biogenesis protein CcmF